ncbi:hypothetical protein LCGC14_1098280 [marine sediment metagenome]|uniref:Uncharacterized protein n=1 Tax=marine sediment metagenome TaxID=412755 RepID=A0A0F9MER3_9ZZZZ
MSKIFDNQQIRRAVISLRERSAGLPGGTYRGVPAEEFERAELLRFLALAMAEIKQLRERVHELERIVPGAMYRCPAGG